MRNKILLILLLSITSIFTGCSKSTPTPNNTELTLFKAKALNGDIEAINTLGTYYELQKNYKEARTWYHRGANKKNGLSQYKLGLLYSNYFNDTIKGDYWIKMSAKNGNEKAKLLVQKIQIDKINNIKTIKKALNYKSQKLIKYVIENYDKDVNQRYTKGFTPLHYAIRYQSLEVIKLLIEKGANPKAVTKDGITLFHLAIFYKRDYDIFKYLIEIVPEFINKKDYSGSLPLANLIQNNRYSKENHLKILKLFLENGANRVINSEHLGSLLPLQLGSNNLDIVKLLLKYGANVEKKNLRGLNLMGYIKSQIYELKNHRSRYAYSDEKMQDLIEQYEEVLNYLKTKYKLSYNEKARIKQLIDLTLEDKDLMWERKTYKNKYNLEPFEYCKKLNWAGFNDWRIPTKDEYDSIMLDKAIVGKRIGRASLFFMNPKQFPNMLPEKYLIQDNNSYGLYNTVNKIVTPYTKYKKNTYIRCVRGKSNLTAQNKPKITKQQKIIWKGKVYKTVTSPYTSREWLDRNIGASRVCTALDDSLCFGGLFQWGRKVNGHEVKDSKQSTSLVNNLEEDNSKNFIASLQANSNDWTKKDPDGILRNQLWSKTDGEYICPKSFRVPTKDELYNETIKVNVFNNKDAFSNFLKLPSAGGRTGNGKYFKQGQSTGLWTASNTKSFAQQVTITNKNIRFNSLYRALALSVRCIRDH